MVRLIPLVLCILAMTSTLHAGLSWITCAFHAQRGASPIASHIARHATVAKKKPTKASDKKSKAGNVAKFGIVSPIVENAKLLLGADELNRLRVEWIKEHTSYITAFSDSLRPGPDGDRTEFGSTALEQLFKYADTNGDGTIDRKELCNALQAAGFSWLKEDKKMEQLMEKYDSDGNSCIDVQEFFDAAPTILRQGFVKLAKKNGNDLGFLV